MYFMFSGIQGKISTNFQFGQGAPGAPGATCTDMWWRKLWQDYGQIMEHCIPSHSICQTMAPPGAIAPPSGINSHRKAAINSLGCYSVYVVLYRSLWLFRDKDKLNDFLICDFPE